MQQDMTITSSENISDNVNIDKELMPDILNTEAVELSKEEKKLANFDINEIPTKFLDKNGSINLSALSKSYKELEPLINEKAQWEKERKDFLAQIEPKELSFEERYKIFGLDNFDEMIKIVENCKDDEKIARCEANIYAKYLNKSKEIEKTRFYLQEYFKNPTKELLEKIEDNFDISVHKKVAAEMIPVKDLIKLNSDFNQIKDKCLKAEEFLATTINKYPKHFQNKTFTDLFSLAFNHFGTDLDADIFIKNLDAYTNEILNKVEFDKSGFIQNKHIISELSQIEPNNQHNNNTKLPPVNLLEVEDTALLRKYIRQYYKNKK